MTTRGSMGSDDEVLVAAPHRRGALPTAPPPRRSSGPRPIFIRYTVEGEGETEGTAHTAHAHPDQRRVELARYHLRRVWRAVFGLSNSSLRRNAALTATSITGKALDVLADHLDRALRGGEREQPDNAVERVTPGQTGYEAYGESANWRTFDGRAMPTWAQLGESDTGRETRRRWEAAAVAIVAVHPQTHKAADERG